MEAGFYANMSWLICIAFLQCILTKTEAQVISGFALQPNVSYGNDPQQVMDIYLPEGRDPTVSKVILLIHGGGWYSSGKEAMNGHVRWFAANFPRHVIVNMGYRLATKISPANPKQLDDVTSVFKYITARRDEFKIRAEFGLVGFSAGAHLSLLYSYVFDKSRQVNVVCNIVGPIDFSDQALRAIPEASDLVQYLTGNYTYKEYPSIFVNLSPIYQITRQSPKTISFYGGKDHLIPNHHGAAFEDKLDMSGVYNKYYLYANEGHRFVDPATFEHLRKKTKWFFQHYL